MNKTYKNIITLLFSILVFTHTNVSYAHEFVNIDRIAYKENYGSTLESIAEKSDGSFRVDFSLKKAKIDGKEIEFIVVDNNTDGNEIGDVVSNSGTCNAINLVSDSYPCSISVHFKSQNIDSLESFVIRVVSSDNEDEMLDKVEVKMSKLKASFKGSARNILVLKNLSSQEITIAEMTSGGKVIEQEEDTKLITKGKSKEVALDSSSNFFPVEIKYEYQIGGQVVKGDVKITGSTVAVNEVQNGGNNSNLVRDGGSDYSVVKIQDVQLSEVMKSGLQIVDLGKNSDGKSSYVVAFAKKNNCFNPVVSLLDDAGVTYNDPDLQVQTSKKLVDICYGI